MAQAKNRTIKKKLTTKEVTVSTDRKGPYAAIGKGKRYYYKPRSKESRRGAIKKAIKEHFK